MFCPRCGAEMKPEQRYCMKCGALNYEHPDNQKMKQYITDDELEKAKENYLKTKEEEKDTIEIAGKVYSNVPKEEKESTYVDTRATIGLLSLITIVLLLVCYFYFPFSIVMSFLIAVFFFIITFYVLVSISIYMKGGYSGFTPLIPFYGQYAFSDITLGNGWLFLLLFVPVVNVVYLCYASYQLGKVFGKGGWLTLFFPFIMLPIIAYSDEAIYQGKGKKYERYVEKGKRRNTKIPGFVYCVAAFVLLFFLLQTPLVDPVAKMFLEKDVEYVFDTVKKDVEDGFYTCSQGELNSVDGVYYIPFDNATDVFMIPFPVRSSMNGEEIRGYVRVVRSGTTHTYFYAMTDGEYVISTDQNITEVGDVIVPSGAITCKKS